MNSEPITFRTEDPDDFDSITEVINEAFAGKPYADGDEADVVLRLRQVNALSLSLIAERGGELLGHATFSPVANTDGARDWYALGPIAVYPKRQSEGIGAKLIHEGFARLRALGAAGVMLTGNPDYYQRFGFEFSPEHCPENEPPEYFMIKPLRDGPLPRGAMAFHPAFYGEVSH